MEEISSLRPEILGTNSVPSSGECDLIRMSLIPFHAEKCLALDAEVDRAQAALAALQHEQRTQHELLDAHKALLTPMRRVIPDVLLKIFHHCRDQFLESPMHLGKVCRNWRELVLSTPTLWTLVLLHDAMPPPRIVPFARACTKYSGSCPIKVIVKFMRRRQDQRTRRALYDALEILARHVDRWQAFEVFLDSTFWPDGGFELPRNGPLIERLVLMIDRPTPLPFSYLPNLGDLRLASIQPQDIPLLLQCTQLRNLSIGGTSNKLTLMDCWTILSNCLKIEVFNIASVNSDITVLPKKEITLSCLQELRIGPWTPDPAPLIHCIKTPVLQRLRLIVGTSTDFDSSCVKRLVQERRPPLTSLSLVNVDGADVATCLPLLPELTSLTLQHTSAMDLVITRLIEQDSHGEFHCPILVHFALRLCLFTGARLVDLARERRRVAGGLRVLVDSKALYKPREFVGLTIELSLVGEFTDSELKELYDMQT